MLLSRRRAVIRCQLCVKNVNARIGFARPAVNPTRMIAIALVAVARAKSVQAVKATARGISNAYDSNQGEMPRVFSDLQPAR